MTSLTPIESTESMTTTTTTTATTAAMQFSHCQQPFDILRILNQQRDEATFCDVIIRTASSNDSTIHAHRCILAASSDYFAALFRHSSTDDARITEVVIPVASLDVTTSVIQFLYTGFISVSDKTLEETVRLADYLGICKVLDFCSAFIKRKLDHCNCIKFKVLSDLYPLDQVTEFVRNYILPRMAAVVRCRETAEAPVETLRQLLTDNELNYPKESDLLRLIQNCLKCQPDLDPGERLKALRLLDCIDFEFLSPEAIRRDVLSDPDTLEWLNSKPQLFTELRNMDSNMGSQVNGGGRDYVETIICRSKTSSRTGDELQLLLYLVREDSWRTVKHPKDETEVRSWTGLETMVVHDSCLYTLSSHTEDMNGYMHPSKETKVFCRLNLRTGEWERLPSPSIVSRQTMLVSMEDTLVAVDLEGKVERFQEVENQWVEWCTEGLSRLPVCFLPVTKSGDLYLFRTVSSGHSFEFCQRSFSLCHLRANSHSWVELSEIEDTELFHSCDQVNLFDCAISPGFMSFKDELGHTRAEFNSETREWSARPQRISRPAFIRDIFGSAECRERVYFVARSALGLENIFMMYDHSKSRFKMVQEPPTYISGLLCHVTMPMPSVELLTNP